ncbi:sensor histidine kinase [Catellatospora citrea]|uniref:histidine kinase n=1 Tax=Catellatospora citrea TaxID=53366 RepID=A0A8J3NXL4_9ACTN|nr:histidine kinase [Catellatospora citrea]RKE12838.1 signal transduction histidine kinase [Catellatospora citrea]GIF95921.1 two-component sensor histidine kinase [Catellatospora citrea]
MTTAPTPAHPPRLLRHLLPGDLHADGVARRRTARDWAVDVACFVFAVLVGLTVYDMEAAGRPVPQLIQLADLVAGAVLCLALFWRRRFPLALAVATAVAGAFSPLSGGAAVVALVTLGARGRLGAVLAVGAGHAVLSLPYLHLYPDPDVSFWPSVAWTWLLLAMITGWALVVGARRQLVRSLRERAVRAEAEQELRVAQARQLERTRIAREMHDVLAHRISLLSLHAGALEFRPDASPEEVAQAAGVIRDSAHQALQDLRAVIGVLRTPDESGDEPQRPQPTLSDLPELVAESLSAGMRVQLTQRLPDPVELPAHAGRTAYRVVQEGLTNARKHAPGAAVQVAVVGAPENGLTVEVLSRAPLGGAPATAIPGTGTGLVGLAERVSLAGGRIEHGRTPAGDFRLWTWQPWPA